jgi:hypothetical protein
MLKPFECSRCHRTFKTRRATRMHIDAIHEQGDVIKRKPRPTEPDDESIADRCVQAQLDRAMGIPNDDIDWLLP